jgi:hypothetical protein
VQIVDNPGGKYWIEHLADAELTVLMRADRDKLYSPAKRRWTLGLMWMRHQAVVT